MENLLSSVKKKKAQYKGILIWSYCSALFLVPTKVSLLYMHIHLQEKCTEKLKEGQVGKVLGFLL